MKTKIPRKQRKMLYSAPMHKRQKLVSVNLAPHLRKQFSKRSLSPRKGDTVKIMVGKSKNVEGKIIKIDLKRLKVYVDGVDAKKVDGSKVQVGIHPSNLMLTKVDLKDKKRQKILLRVIEKEKVEKLSKETEKEMIKMEEPKQTEAEKKKIESKKEKLKEIEKAIPKKMKR